MHNILWEMVAWFFYGFFILFYFFLYYFHLFIRKHVLFKLLSFCDLCLFVFFLHCTGHIKCLYGMYALALRFFIQSGKKHFDFFFFFFIYSVLSVLYSIVCTRSLYSMYNHCT